VAFGGRILGEGEGERRNQPKYLNSPETPVYVKSRHLYALNLSRREIVREGFALLVEGYTDVIGLWQAGIRNVAATLGTALGEEHLRLLSRLTERVILAFDADAAGISASERGLDFYSRFDLDLRVMRLEEGMDPAEYVLRRGPREFLRRVEESVPLVDFCLEKVLSAHDPSDNNSRLRGVKRAVYLVANLGRDIDHERYVKEIADWAGSGYQAVLDLYRRAAGRQAGERTAAESSILVPPHLRAERELLRLLLHHPYLVERAREELDAGLFEDRHSRLILEALLGARTEDQDGERLVMAALQSLEAEAVRNTATALIFDSSGNVDNVRREEADIIYGDLLASLKELYIERQIRRLKKELEELSLAPLRDHEREQELAEEIYSLERLKRELR